MAGYESILATASQLPVAERILLIDALWETVPEEELPPLSDEWLREIKRRSVEFDHGTVSTIAWKEIREEALNRLSAKGQ